MRHSRHPWLLRLLVLGAWLTAVALLLRYEAYPEYFTHTLPGYRSLLDSDVLLEDTWTRILYKERPIGYSHTSVEVADADPRKHYTMVNRTYVRLKAMGLDQPVFVDTTAYVDITHRLQEFNFVLSSKAHTMRIRGVREGSSSQFKVSLTSGAGTQRSTVEIPDDVILYSPMTEMALKRLRPGAELAVRTFDPATLAPSRMVVRAIGEETVPGADTNRVGMRLETEFQGITVRSWVARDGTLLRQETPLGWTMETSTADEALAAVRESAHGGDWVADFAVRLEGKEIPDARVTRLVRLKISGAELAPEGLRRSRQKVTVVEGGVEVEVVKSRYPEAGAPAEPLAADVRAALLASTPFVQADHPEMRAMAEAIVAGCTTDADKARAITRWVNANVKKEITISLPSALDVLKQRTGDCNEHTYLYVALARAVGLPAKIMVGLAYNQGAFYYHAWPAVHVGAWVEVDPTWGEDVVDATHLCLVEGELGQQVDIIKLVGRLRVEVLEVL